MKYPQKEFWRLKLMNIKKELKKKIPKWLLELHRMLRVKNYFAIRDHRVAFGEKNIDKIFYVFREDVELWGIYSIVFNSYLLRLEKVLKEGYIPVFDQQNYRPYCLEDGNTLNLWYAYFDKTDDYTELSEVYKSRNVILSTLSSTEISYDTNTIEGFNHYNQPNIRDIFNRYFKVNKVISEQVKAIYHDSFLHKGKVLGVAIRECYRFVADTGQMPGHPNVFTPDKQIQLIKKYMMEWNCQSLFLLTDDRENLEIMQREFEDRLIVYEHPLYRYYKEGKPILERSERMIEFGDERPNMGELNKHYLIKVELLSKCDCLLSSISSAAEAAILRNDGKYDRVELYDLGKSGVK